MNFYQNFRLTCSMLSAQIVFAAISSGTALAQEKTLTLSHSGDLTFKFSTNEPLAGNETSLHLEIGRDVLALVVSEQLQNVTAYFDIFLANGTVLKRSLAVEPNSRLDQVVDLSELIVEVSANIKIDGNYELVRPRRVKANYEFQSIVECRNIRIDQAVDQPEIRRLQIEENLAYRLHLDADITAKVVNDVPVFSANLGAIGLPNHYPGMQLDVRKENNSLVLKKTFSDGRGYDTFTFGQECSFR